MKRKDAHVVQIQGGWGARMFHQRMEREEMAEQRGLNAPDLMLAEEDDQVMGVSHVLNQLKGEMLLRHPVYDMSFAVDAQVHPRMVYLLACGEYQRSALQLIDKAVGVGDVVIDLGAGFGVAATLAAIKSKKTVVVVEPQAAMVPLLGRTAELNKVRFDVVQAAVVPGQSVGETEFFVREEPWSSSLFAGELEDKQLRVPVLPLADLIKRNKATVLLVDVQGAEVGLFDELDLSGVRSVVLTTHPDLIGEDGVARLLRVFQTRGFVIAGISGRTFHLERD